MAFFALLVAVCIAGPVLAETPVEAGEAPEPPELQRDEALETPQAVAEREDSEYAFAGLSAAQEGELLQNRFPAQLEAIDADPARALADVTIERIDSPTEALVTLEGEQALLESEVPLRAPEEDGDLHKVELGLEATAAGFEPANPLVDLTLPDSAGEPIGIGSEGLAITPVGTDPAAATPLGDEDLLLPGAQEDTSLLLSPIAGGLELSAMLASRNSPEQLDFDVTLPAGASLRAGEGGGAEVLGADGEPIATITAPLAVDAQGTEIPATLTVQGDSLGIAVPHRELDVAYPLFVDPEFIEENWSGFADAGKLGYWHWAWSGVAGAEDFIGRTSCIVTCWGNGLYVRARSNFTYPGGSWGRWWFTPQGSTTYMNRVVLGPINYDAHGCTANEPHGYVGVWNDYSGWVVRSNAFPSGWATSIDAPNLPVGSRTAFVGIHAESNSNLNCGRDYRLGGASLFLKDAENPTANATSGYPTGWVKSGATFTINAPASDAGVGLKKATLSPQQTVYQAKELGCDGHYSNQCPSGYTFQFPMGAGNFDEGEKSVKFSVEDALGKPSNTYQWNMKVDRTPPEIELAGQLAQATDETEGDSKDDKDKPLPLPVYNLTVNATDGVLNPADGGQKRSGVKKIQVYIDNRAYPEQTWEASSCAAGNCPLSKVFTLKLNELSADTEHYLRILATDFAGNTPRERKVEFEYIPATGLKDEYVMQYFPLPDGSGNEAEEEHPSRPEFAVNLVSGNLVYRQEDLDVSGAAADLELELFYNSLLPGQQNTEWGDGWTLAQTPELEIEDPGAGAPSEATIVDESAMVESKVDLPAAPGEEEFDKRLQATVEKEPGGGYALSDESGETGETISFDSSGKAQELTNGTAATVEYDYEEGDLSAITIEDPGTADADPESIEEGEASAPLEFLHSANFGSNGSADGQMKAPADVAIDDAGNLFVLDRGNSRIEKFGPDGSFISKFGSAGTGDGQLNLPSAITLDAAGNILVAENFRVQKFSPSGEFLAKFGSIGMGDGQFLTNPSGIAVAGDGSIWVSDLTKVQRFSAGGQFIERIGASGPGQIGQIEGLAATPEGEVLVADTGLDRVKAFDAEGDFVREFGSSGTGPGQFSKPVELSVDREGQVWIGDEETDRVQVFTAAGDYLAGFGASGTGADQLDLKPRSGIAVEGGRVWIADAGNDRLDRWIFTGISSFLHSANFGSKGSADGQMKAPADVAIDDAGNLFVLDRGNSRIEKFGPDGSFISKFGSAGTGDGQLNYPSAIALDGEGNVLVAENHRVQKLSPSGAFLAKFGSIGMGDGQFLTPPSGIAVAGDGSIWVSNSSKVQRFSAAGQFIERVGASGQGQLNGAEGLASTPDGEVLALDAVGDRVVAYDQNGAFLRQFGQSGTDPGRLATPVELSVDSKGQVWIADSQTDRVQVFTAGGDYLAGFGTPGEGTKQLNLESRSGIAVELGRVWIADAGNDRMDEWVGGNYEPSEEPVLTEDDPQLEVEVSEGLVDTVEGEESGTIDYQHSGDLLTAVDGPDGEAQFSYDSAGRMTKATLPNGTYGEVAYEATYGRVKSVTVAVEGKNPKTTYFSWSDEPHRTTVTPPDAPATTYDIAADGSIFKWWNAKEPPVLDDLAGSLYESRETATSIATGAHNLVIQAHDEEGIASIQVIANNNQLVDERSCDYDPEHPSECLTETNEWVTETANWPPGIVYLEVIATDRLGEATSQRFWVNIPYTPPPDPEAEEPPRFGDILRFREEFGLDLDLKGDELAINDRIFELMGDWNNPTTPAGEVARATEERWSVPLRVTDAAEMDFREAYIHHDIPIIDEWAEAQYQSSYGGTYVSHSTGGVIHVGFSDSAPQRLAELKQQLDLWVPDDRLALFEKDPLAPRQTLESIANSISDAMVSNPSVSGLITDLEIDEAANRVKVGAKDVNQVKAALASIVGSLSAIEVYGQPSALIRLAGRLRASGRILAGDRILGERDPHGTICTAGFGAWETRAEKSTGEDVKARFLLTAGHCVDIGSLIGRSANPDLSNPVEIGPINRSAFESGIYRVDGAAARVAGGLAPQEIYRKGMAPRPVGEPVRVKKQTLLCFSGLMTDKKECGQVVGMPEDDVGGFIEAFYKVRMKALAGDSGAPVWEASSGDSVGLISGSLGPETILVAPLRSIRNRRPAGLLEALSLPDPGKPQLQLIQSG